MGPKKKDTKKKGGEPVKPVLKAVDKQFYELTIADLNNKLSRLRSYVSQVEVTNKDLLDKMRQFDEDRTDVTAHLDRAVTEKELTIIELNEHLTELAQQRAMENKDSAQKIKEKEKKYTVMHEKMSSEIKLLSAKLNSLEEFRINRDDLLTKYDEQATIFKNQERKHREVLSELEQKSILEKDHLKKDVEKKLLQLSEDFTKSSEIRIAGYTRRLIRENIALNKEMDKMIITQQRMERENEEIKKKTLEINENFETNEITKQRLVKTCQNQIEILEKLTTQYERLKNKHVELLQVEKLHQNSIKRDAIDKLAYNDMSQKLRIMTQRFEMAKTDKQKLISLHIQNENEVLKLRDVIKNINYHVKSAIRGENEICHNDEPFRQAQRTSLLSALQSIISDYQAEIFITPSVSTISSIKSIYRPGQAGFIPKSKASLLELIKREAKNIESSELLSPQLSQYKITDGKITPRPRILISDTLFDIECGSTLVFSSTSTQMADLEPQEDAKGEAQGGGQGGGPPGGCAGSSSSEGIKKMPTPEELSVAEVVPDVPQIVLSETEIKKTKAIAGSGDDEYIDEDEEEIIDEDEDNEIDLYY